MLIFKLIVYILAAYGLTEILVFFNGPFDIVEKFRKFAHWLHPKFGELFTCVACTSTWIGLILSALNYFLIDITVTPFNIILEETKLWWVIIFMDGMFTCGIVWLLYQLEEMLERIGNK